MCIRLPVFRTTPEARTAPRSSLSSVLAQQREQLASKGRNIRRLPAADPVAVANDFLINPVSTHVADIIFSASGTSISQGVMWSDDEPLQAANALMRGGVKKDCTKHVQPRFTVARIE